MTIEYSVPDSELKPWERRIRRWAERHPDTAQRVDNFIGGNPEFPERWVGATMMALFAALPCWLLAAVAVVLAVIFGGTAWPGIALAFTASAVIFTFATVVVAFEDRGR